MTDHSPIAGWLRKAKDSSTSFLAARAAGAWMERYGRMLTLNIDSEKKSIECKVHLKGESEAMTVRVNRYELVTEGADSFVVIREADASREWLSAILADFVCGKKIPVPEKYATILRMIA